MMVWAFNSVPDDEVTGDDARKKVYQSIKSGKSRFGWSQKEEHNLLLENNWTEWHSKQLFLLQVEREDWIVHINTPEWGKCIAAKVKDEYDFDDGLQCNWGPDFRHYFNVYPETIVEFDRGDPNILPAVNLKPRYRYHRVKEVEAFLQSIENLKSNNVSLKDGETKYEYHLKNKTDDHLSKISDLIQKMYKGKNLEGFLAKVFRKIPGVTNVEENGIRWGTDYGADLIVTMITSLGDLTLEHKIVVQIKSFEGRHYKLEAVGQIKAGIERYEGTAGMIITTAETTKELEDEVGKISGKIGRQIDVLASSDVSKFIIKHAPELLFRI